MVDVEKFKKILTKERQELEKEVSQMGKRNPRNWRQWIPSLPKVMSYERADKNELADRFEDFEEKRSTETQLQIRLNNVVEALNKIKEGSYGTCGVCGEKIKEERLMANPAAITCIKHTK